ncbi:hypothetical protein M9H77_08720 [Catharanthus roseus]|uniref:Uncharacterized protein n=1 Tax=Catharanthus roseus TaxID=4058 RepID=A0ACC0BYP1_CATRO|nr:hypothetical protein M9H77_08720 [Catharanthus roseus]
MDIHEFLEDLKKGQTKPIIEEMQNHKRRLKRSLSTTIGSHPTVPGRPLIKLEKLPIFQKLKLMGKFYRVYGSSITYSLQSSGSSHSNLDPMRVIMQELQLMRYDMKEMRGNITNLSMEHRDQSNIREHTTSHTQ